MISGTLKPRAAVVQAALCALLCLFALGAQRANADEPTKPEASDMAKLETKPASAEQENRPEAKTEAKPEAKTEEKAEAKPEEKVEAKPEAKTEAKIEAKPEAKTETKPEVKPETKPDLRVEAISALRGRLDLIFASDLAGDLYGQTCDEVTPRKNRGLLSLANAIAAAKSRGPASLIIGAGGLLGPGSGARFLLHSVTGSHIAAELFHDAGLEVVIPGVQDFEMANETLLSYLEGLRRSSTSTMLSNITCAANEQMLCRLLSTQQMVNRGGIKVGLLSAIPEDAPQRVGPGHLHGAKVAAWSTLIAVAKKLRPQVDALVVAVDLSGKFGLDQAISLARDADAAGARIDVMHITREDSPTGGVLSLQLTNGTLIVATPAGGSGVTRVMLQQRSAEEIAIDHRALAISTERVAPQVADAAITTTTMGLASKLARERQRMCSGWSLTVAPLPQGGLDRNAVTRLVLNAMRSAAHAEIALINAGAIADGGLPLRTATVHAVGNVLPFKGQVVVTTVTGKDVGDALGKYSAQGADAQLRMLGIAKKDDGLVVNGRPISTTETYRVVSIDFVAAGGNGLLPEKFFDKSRSSVAYDDLRHLVLEYMRERGAQDAVTAPLELEKRPLWRSLLDVGIDLQNVTVSNPGNLYDRPQLSRQPSIAFKFDGTWRGEMDQPRHLLQLTLRGLYGQSWLSTQVDANTQSWIGQETADLITLLALYSYRGFSAKKPRLPTPYFSLGLESEFNRPDTRNYHHLELSSAVGARAALPGRINANVGIGVRTELLANQFAMDETERDVARGRFLITTTIEMPKRALWPRLGNSLLGEFSVNYNFTDPQVLRSHELRGIGKLYVELGRPLYLTMGTELYLYRDRDNAPGVALDVTAGLKIVMNGHRQQF